MVVIIRKEMTALISKSKDLSIQHIFAHLLLLGLLVGNLGQRNFLLRSFLLLRPRLLQWFTLNKHWPLIIPFLHLVFFKLGNISLGHDVLFKQPVVLLHLAT